MQLTVRQESLTSLASYGEIPVSFIVKEVLDLDGITVGQAQSTYNRKVISEYEKNYDAIEGNDPLTWTSRLSRAEWGLFAAYADDERVGGMVVARDNHDAMLVDGFPGSTIVWDLRVAPSRRGQGVGTALFRDAEFWAVAHGCSRIQVETQDINVPACLFYAHQGCLLERVRRNAYPGFPNEVQLIWSKKVGVEIGEWQDL